MLYPCKIIRICPLVFKSLFTGQAFRPGLTGIIYHRDWPGQSLRAEGKLRPLFPLRW